MVIFQSASDIAEFLGTKDSEPKNNYFCVFVPSRTRDEESIDHDYWVQETVTVMSKLFGGITCFQGYGGWLDVERDKTVKKEKITIAVSFITDEELNADNFEELKVFLYRMGRETGQGEIGYIVNGDFWTIEDFNHE